MAAGRGATQKHGWAETLDLSSREGLDDFEVLCALSHDPEYVWMAPGRIADRSAIEAGRVTASLDRLASEGLVMRHPSRLDLFGETSSVRPWLRGAGTQDRASAA